MNKYLVIIFILFSFSCKSKSDNLEIISGQGTDTVYINCPVNNDSLYTVISELRTDISKLKTQMYISKYKIRRVKYYVSIVDKNPSQIKYLKGWIKRAIK